MDDRDTLKNNVHAFDVDVNSTVPEGVKLLRTLRVHARHIRNLQWSPDGKLIAAPTIEGKVFLWAADNGCLMATLQGHQRTVAAVDFNPKGNTIASASADRTAKIWDTQTGSLLRTLEGHSLSVVGVAFSPSGKTLATASNDGIARLWNAKSGELIYSLESHTTNVKSVAFDPDGRILASANDDGTIKLWNVSTGRLLNTLNGHKGLVNGIAFRPSGTTLASAGSDGTVRVWDLGSNKLLFTIEGHSSETISVAFSHDGRLLVSNGSDKTIRLWNSKNGASIGRIHAPQSIKWPPGFALNPIKHQLATVTSDPAIDDENNLVICIWSLNSSQLLAHYDFGSSYVTAKIVLVGNSGVGKTGLGWRLTHEEFKEHSSTHGQQFWVLNDLAYERPDGAACEAVLWDLAGQPEYRLVHALYLDDIDLALVLYDPTDDDDSFCGADFWLKRLQKSCLKRAIPILLVAARCDRGSSLRTQKDITDYLSRHNISVHTYTSAKSGTGISELIAAMKENIRWDEIPATVATITFQRIKNYVIRLKENPSNYKTILSIEMLRIKLEGLDDSRSFEDSEILTAIGHLERHGYVKILQTSSGDVRVLLSPELLNNLAASITMEARNDPRELGSLNEDRLLAGEYTFSEFNGLSHDDRRVLVDSAILLFVKNSICFREKDPLAAVSYLVFPELIKQKRPTVDDRISIRDGSTYFVTGAFENVYASLVVLLGYTQQFTRTTQWHNQVRYVTENGHICGFRKESRSDDAVEFTLYFGTNVSPQICKLFQSFFETFLYRTELNILRVDPTMCINGHSLILDVVRERLRESATFAFCSTCGEKVSICKSDTFSQLTNEQKQLVQTQHHAASLRTEFEQLLLKFSIRANPRPTCFISYAWGNKVHESWIENFLAKDLVKAGVDVQLDRWSNSMIGSSIPRFIEQIPSADKIVVVGTTLYRKNYENENSSRGHISAAECDLINKRMIGTEALKSTVLPILLEGNEELALPPLLQSRVRADFRDPNNYFSGMFDLIRTIYMIAYSDPIVADFQKVFFRDE